MQSKAIVAFLVPFMVASVLAACAAPSPAPAPAPAPTPAPTPAPAPEKIVWTLNYFATPGQPKIKTILEEWGPRVAAAVGPEYEFVLNPVGGGTLASGEVIPEAMKAGLFEMSEWPAYSPEKCPLYHFTTYPIGPADLQRGGQVAFDYLTSPVVKEEFAKWNSYPLATMVSDPQEGIYTFPAKGVDDLVGKKIRVWGAYIKAFDLLGVSVVSFSSAELYEALKRGTVDGGITGFPTSIVGRSLQEVGTDILVFGGSGHLSAWVCSLDAWHALPPKVQNVMLEVGAEVPAAAAQVMEADRAKAFEALEAAGTTIRYASPEDRQRYMDAFHEMINAEVEEFDQRGVPASEGYAVLKEAVARWQEK